MVTSEFEIQQEDFMGNNIYKSVTFFGNMDERQRLIADVVNCQENHQENGWLNLSLLASLPQGDETSDIGCLVHNLDIYKEADKTSIGCISKGSSFEELFLHISTGYPSLIFQFYATERIYLSFDEMAIFCDGRVLVHEVHEANCPQSFFDNRGQVVKPGYPVISEDGRNLVYRHKDIVIGQGYDNRFDDSEDTVIVLEDASGNRFKVPMNSVRRFNAWEAVIAELKQNLFKAPNVKFSHGRFLSTKGVHDLIAEDEKFSCFVNQSLMRHLEGDWGSVPAEDAIANEQALQDGDRLFSAYDCKGSQIWIITEADRSATTIMFPSEY